MKRIIPVLLTLSLLLTIALPAKAETTAKPIPFSGWSQEEEGTAWPRWIENSQQIARYFGQAYLCQTKHDLTALLQTNPEYGDGYDEAFFAEKSLLLLEVFGPQLNDKWYVKNLTQKGTALIADVVFEDSFMGPNAIYSSTLCVELNEKPVDVQTLVVNVTYEGGLPRDPVSLAFAYTDATKVYALGDVDGNGKIEAADALRVLRSTVTKMPPEAFLGNGFLAANVDGEGWPSSTDALLILKKVVGKIRHFPAEITGIYYRPWQESKEDHYVVAQKHEVAVAVFNSSQELAQGLTESFHVSQETAEQLLKKYNDDYFAQTPLLAFSVYAPCTGAKYMVNDLYAVDETLCLDVSLYNAHSDGLTMQPRVYFVEFAQTAVTQTMADLTLREHYGAYGEEQLPFRVSNQSTTIL